MQTPKRKKNLEISIEKRPRNQLTRRTISKPSPSNRVRRTVNRSAKRQDKHTSLIQKPNLNLTTRGLPILSLNKLNPQTTRNPNPNSARVKPTPPSEKASLNNSANNSSVLRQQIHKVTKSGLQTKARRQNSSTSINTKLAELLSPRNIAQPVEVDPVQYFKNQELPMSAGKTLKIFKEFLTPYEQGEILDYKSIYYIGIGATKVKNFMKDVDNYGFDDDKGDYKLMVADHIAYRYEIVDALGKGSFGQVIKAYDHKNKTSVALKVIKNKSRFHQQAAVEIKVLKFLKEHDPSNTANIIHILDFFAFRKHICIVFEMLSYNLYEFIKANNYQGVSINLIRRFGVQLLQCLQLLKKHAIIHCDLKPENILLKHPNRSSIKVIDFGSSCFEDEKIYNYIQSRFYRAPEIILGIPYTPAIDMWSFGCILAELYIGYPLFPGQSEQEQLALIMEVCGIPPADVQQMSTRLEKFFEDGEPIQVTDSRGRVRLPGASSLQEKLRGCDAAFLQFVEKCLEWNPYNRMTPYEAMEHPWISSSLMRQLSSNKRRPAVRRVSNSQPHQKETLNNTVRQIEKQNAVKSLNKSATNASHRNLYQ